jgi:hypothetical protein
MPLFNETVKPVGQPKVSRNVIRLTIALCVFIVLWADSLIGQPRERERFETEWARIRTAVVLHALEEVAVVLRKAGWQCEVRVYWSMSQLKHLLHLWAALP